MAGISNLEYIPGNASPSSAGSVAHAKWVGWRTNPSLIQSRLVVWEAPNQGQDGRPFRGAPERPSYSQTIAGEQDAPGIRRVVRRPVGIVRNSIPKQAPPGMSAMPTTLDPKPPAAFPVGYAAGVGTAIPNDGQAWHIAGPAQWPRASGSKWPKPRRCSRSWPQIPIPPSPRESLDRSLVAFIHMCAFIPPPRVSAPKLAHAKTSTSRI